MARQGTLGLLGLACQFAHGTYVGQNICAHFFLVLLNEVVDVSKPSTKVSITSVSQHFEDTAVYGKERDIKDTSTEVANDKLRFTTLFVKAGPLIVPASLVA